MKRFLRSLVPESPWCANAAAWCGLALAGFYALALAARAGYMVCERVVRARMLRELASGAAVHLPVSGSTVGVHSVSVAVAGQFTPLLAAAALLAVAHALSFASDLRGPAAPPPVRARRGAVVFAAVLAVATVPSALYGLGTVALALVGWEGSGVFHTLWTAAGAGMGIAYVLGLSVLPFCLLRLADRDVPAADAPADAAALRRLEAWTSAALAAGGALAALDALSTLFGGWFGAGLSVGTSLALGLLAAQFLPAVVALFVLAAVRSVLRRLAAEGGLPDEPGRWASPVIVTCVLAAFAVIGPVVGVILWNDSGATEDGFDIRGIRLVAAVLVQFWQLFFAADLLRLLPVPAARPPAPARGPEGVWPRRVLRVVLVLAALLAVRCVWNGFARFLDRGDALRFAPPPVELASVDWDAVTVVRGPRDAAEWIERPGWTDEDRALLAVWSHSLQEENGTVDPFFPDPTDGSVELSGNGFTVLFAGDRLVAFLGRRTIARRLNGFDLVILDKLRHVTPSPDADEPRADSAEGAEP
ncbi:MAG: hypothetical protein IJV65_05255 [Kiritimatiellae bacterium]|nr:hypothetical protein [Kiritimatiellia bacterium]